MTTQDAPLLTASRLAAAFTTVVTSFVSDILLPPISLIPFINKNLDEKFAVLRRGKHYTKEYGYNTLKQALDDGAVVMAYGYVLVLPFFRSYLVTEN